MYFYRPRPVRKAQNCSFLFYFKLHRSAWSHDCCLHDRYIFVCSLFLAHFHHELPYFSSLFVQCQHQGLCIEFVMNISMHIVWQWRSHQAIPMESAVANHSDEIMNFNVSTKCCIYFNEQILSSIYFILLPNRTIFAINFIAHSVRFDEYSEFANRNSCSHINTH